MKVGSEILVESETLDGWMDAHFGKLKKGAGFGLQYVFGNKMKGAEEDCGDQGISFLPILADSLG